MVVEHVVSAVTCLICISARYIKLPCIFKCGIQFVGELRALLPGGLKIQFLSTEMSSKSSTRSCFFQASLQKDWRQWIKERHYSFLKWPLTAFVLLIKILVQPLQILLKLLVTAVELQDYTSHWWQKCEALPILIVYVLLY